MLFCQQTENSIRVWEFNIFVSQQIGNSIMTMEFQNGLQYSISAVEIQILLLINITNNFVESQTIFFTVWGYWASRTLKSDV